MAFTSGPDVNFLSVSDNGKVVGAGAGNDLYIVSPAFLPTGTVDLSDTNGTNTLKLTGGLTIASSKVAADFVQLTLSNGAVINLNGASSFAFEVGGRADAAGVVKTFTQFVTETLGAAAVPTGTTVVDGVANRSIADDGSTPPTPVVDTTAPELLGVAAGTTTVTLNFDEALQDVAPAALLSLFAVTGKNAAGVVSTYPVGVASVNGASVTLGLTQALAGEIKVSYTGNVLKDAAGNAVAAIPATLASTDGVGPTWTLTAPTDGTVGVAASANLTLTFDEGVKLGTGNVSLVNAADATDTRTIAVNDVSQVTFNTTDKTLTINPTADLKAGAAYTVALDGSAVRDLSGNANTVGGDLVQNFTVTGNVSDVIPVTLPAAGATTTVPLANVDAGAADTTAAKNTGTDTVVLATKPVTGSTIEVPNFTLGGGTDADTLQLGGYTGLSALTQDIGQITVSESTSAFAQLFNGDATHAPKQFLNFDVTVNGAHVLFNDLIALDVLAAPVKAMLNAGFVDGTGDGADTQHFTLPADIATLIGTFADNLSFGA